MTEPAGRLGHHQGISGPTGDEGFAEARAFAVGAGQSVVDVDPFGLDAEPEQSVALRRQVLLVGRASGIPDK